MRLAIAARLEGRHLDNSATRTASGTLKRSAPPTMPATQMGSAYTASFRLTSGSHRFQRKARVAPGGLVPLEQPYTVADALADYRTDYARLGGNPRPRRCSVRRQWPPLPLTRPSAIGRISLSCH